MPNWSPHHKDIRGRGVRRAQSVIFRQKWLTPTGNRTKIPRTPRPQSDHRAGGAKLRLTETITTGPTMEIIRHCWESQKEDLMT